MICEFEPLAEDSIRVSSDQVHGCYGDTQSIKEVLGSELSSPGLKLHKGSHIPTPKVPSWNKKGL